MFEDYRPAELQRIGGVAFAVGVGLLVLGLILVVMGGWAEGIHGPEGLGGIGVFAVLGALVAGAVGCAVRRAFFVAVAPRPFSGSILP